jgi:trehalose-phosphatase
MSLPLYEHSTAVAARVTVASHLLLGLDFDGTLTPIVAVPSQAALTNETRQIVTTLAAQPDTSIAIVSGRRLDEVRSLVGIDGLIYAGNHGLEIRGPAVSFTEPTAANLQRPLGWLAAALERGLAQIPGAVVENKALTVSVHYRQVEPAKVEEVIRHVHAAAAVRPDWFRTTMGNQVLEVRPRVDWHKGTAVRWIAGQLGKPDALILYMGDDATDEDAFQTLIDGITIKVGAAGDTAAHYHVDSPAAAAEFLAWLASVRALHPARAIPAGVSGPVPYRVPDSGCPTAIGRRRPT